MHRAAPARGTRAHRSRPRPPRPARRPLHPRRGRRSRRRPRRLRSCSTTRSGRSPPLPDGGAGSRRGVVRRHGAGWPVVSTRATRRPRESSASTRRADTSSARCRPRCTTRPVPASAARSTCSAAVTASASSTRSCASTRPGAATKVGTLPAASSDSTAAVVGEHRVRRRRLHGTPWLDTIVAFTPGAGARVVAHLPTPLRYAAVGAVDGRIVIAGGSTPVGARDDRGLRVRPEDGRR